MGNGWILVTGTSTGIGRAVALRLDQRPKTRYLVGRDARLQAAVQTLLPDRVRDRLVARLMGV